MTKSRSNCDTIV